MRMGAISLSGGCWRLYERTAYGTVILDTVESFGMLVARGIGGCRLSDIEGNR